MSNLTDATDAALTAERASSTAQAQADAETIAILRDQHVADGQTIDEMRASIADLQSQLDALRPRPVLTGRSASNYDHGPLTQADLVRVYSFGAVDAELAASGATALFLSDERGIGAGQAARLDNALSALFAKHPDVTVYWHPENEVTAHPQTTSSAFAYVAKTREQKAVTDKHPNVFMSVNLTAYGVREGRHLPHEQAGLIPLLDSVTSSLYNPGRDNTPPVWDPFELYVDPVLDVVARWSDQLGRRLPFGTGEYGNPVDPRDPAKRPAYAIDFRLHVDEGCEIRNLPHIGDSYWDNQKAGGPDNRLLADSGATAQAWKGALT